MFETIYNLFKIEMDGEEFDADEDALTKANVAYRTILRQRNWKFLNKTTQFAAGVTDLSTISDLDKVLKLWRNGEELVKTTFEQRFDDSKDYWIDHVGKKINYLSNSLLSSVIDVDYKYKPVDLTETNTPLVVDGLENAIALQMCLDYYSKDQDLTVYTKIEEKLSKAIDSLINYNENL